MNMPINFYLSIIICSLTISVGACSSPKVMQAAFAVGAIQGAVPRKGFPKLAFERINKNCAKCGTNKDLLARHGCGHIFCSGCLNAQKTESCSECSARHKRCVICLEPLEKRKTRVLLCKHEFHRKCIIDWEDECTEMKKEKKCPTCGGPLKYIIKTKCEFCTDRLNNKSEINGPPCEINEWAWWGIFPYIVTKKVNHAVHDHCLNQFIDADVRYDKGEYVYRCTTHGTWHVLSNEELEKYGLKPISAKPKLKKKRKKKPEKTSWESMLELCTGIKMD